MPAELKAPPGKWRVIEWENTTTVLRQNTFGDYSTRDEAFRVVRERNQLAENDEIEQTVEGEPLEGWLSYSVYDDQGQKLT